MVRYLHPGNHNSRKVRKTDKDFAIKFDFKDIKFPFKIRDIHKIEKKKIIRISVFGYKNNGKPLIYMSKNTFKRHVDLFLMGEEGKKHYVLIIDFDTFMYDDTLHRGRKNFCRYCLLAFSTV